ncbi:MAG TPA: UvrD-helicase domain-containing protein, partial [Gaiellaceae bacterium]|nr:UvrD-helicase domain-containing protein [Gaiellaceae bacterium]
ELDGAWISTIHGFCHRLLRSYPAAAGVDPRFRVLDESQASVLRAESFDAALEEFCSGEHPDRVRLLATYGAGGLRRMLGGVAETLRAAGRPLELGLEQEPDLFGGLSRLRAAAEAALAESDEGTAVDVARVQLARAMQLVDSAPPVDLLLDLSDIAVKGRGQERFRPYEDARLALEQTALNAAAVRDRDLLQELLELFAAEYQRAKDAEGALDFEDLQLRARDLLSADEAVRSRERLRFRSIMVDEFQDTNQLQCEIIDQFDPEELFFVGDEFQSIYRFRHADVEVFKERRAGSEDVLPLRANYRSRPELLDVVNELFAGDFGEGYEPLVAAGRFPDPAQGPAVELLVNDKASYKDTGGDWRRGEARAVAQRVRELCDEGVAKPGEVVLLFAAGTDAEVFEDELRAAGLPTYRAAGRGYFGQQQVLDVLSYLRLLHNRYDDEAVAAVLASPLVGVSNDALMLLRRAASRKPLFAGLERELPSGLSARDEQLFRAFRQRYDRLVALSTRAGLERLIDQIVSEHDYDLAVLAQHDGRRRYANLRKLGRLARSYEALRGRDVEGFVRFVADRQASGAHEAEAFAEEEAGDAVRLLTIHAAKGLEFRVVVVADAGRDRPPSRGEEIICRPDGLFGFKVLDPATGRRRGAFDYEAVREAEQAAEEAERLRLYYVAMTRAIDRLLVCGSIDPARAGEARTPIGWVLERLGSVAIDEVGEEPVLVERGTARLLLRVTRATESVQPEPQPARAVEVEQLSLFRAEEDAGPAPVALPPLEPLEQPPAFAPQRLSYSALATFDSCPAKFYARYVAGMRERRGEPTLGALGVGSAVHELLERIDLAAPAVPADLAALRPDASVEELAKIEDFLAAYCGSALATRLAGLEGARREQSFAFEHDGVVLHGFIDVLHLGPRALVVDFKTNALDGDSAERVAEEDYRLQRLVYAIACFRAGAEEVEVVYQFLERPDEPVVTVFTKADLPRLEQELSTAIASIRAGTFEPTPSERVCSDCPALDVVCAGPRLRTARGA